MGTVDNIFVFHGLITHLLKKKKTLYTAFVDFTKAFEYLVRIVIWHGRVQRRGGGRPGMARTTPPPGKNNNI